MDEPLLSDCVARAETGWLQLHESWGRALKRLFTSAALLDTLKPKDIGQKSLMRDPGPLVKGDQQKVV